MRLRGPWMFMKDILSKKVLKCHNNLWQFVLQRHKAVARAHAPFLFHKHLKALKAFAERIGDWLN